VAHTARESRVRIISARRATRQEQRQYEEELAKRGGDELRPEYDLARLKGGGRGKYYKQASAGTNLIPPDPDVARAFPDSSSVNRALRLLQGVATKSSRSARTSAGARHRATG
jgi:hypothetical protein